MKKLFVFLFVICTFSAFGQVTYDVPEIIYRDGTEYQCFTTGSIQVILSVDKGAPLRGFDKNPMVTLLVKNNGTHSVLVDPSNLTAVAVNGDKYKDVDVYTQKQLKSKVNKKIIWFGPNDTEKVQVSTTVEHKNKYGETTSTTKGTTTSEVYTGEGSNERTKAAHFIDHMYLKKNSVMPNESISGIIMTDKVKKGSLVVTFKVGSDIFVSTFKM